MVTTRASGSSLGDFLDQPGGDLLAAADDLDDVDHLALAGQALHRVQVSEDAGIVHGAGRGQHRQDREPLAEQLDGVAFLQPGSSAASAPTSASCSARFSMTRLRASGRGSAP